MGRTVTKKCLITVEPVGLVEKSLKIPITNRNLSLFIETHIASFGKHCDRVSNYATHINVLQYFSY